MADGLEREVKFAVPDGFSLPELAGVADGVTEIRLRRRVLDAVYWDTPDLRLARWGLSVRHRSGDPGGSTWTVKLPEGGDRLALVRRELSFAGPPEVVPAAAARLLTAYVRSAPLVVAIRLRTVRTGVGLRDAEGRRVVDVVDDAVTVVDGARTTACFREVEAEVFAGAPPGLLDAVVARLRAAGAGEPQDVPKVVRALGQRATDQPELAPARLGRRATAADLVRAAFVTSVVRLIRHDPGVRIGDDPEDVHQARVGTRRLRSDLRTFRSLVDADWAAELSGELRWLGGALGAVRDTDVLLERFRRQAGALPERDAVGVAALVRRLARQREDARRELLVAMDGARYVGLLDRLIVDAAAPRVTDEATARAREVAPVLVRRPWRHLETAVAELAADPPDAALHRVRILAKRCRYAADAVAVVAGEPAEAFASAIAALQTVLGDHQDAIVAETWLRAAAKGASAAQTLVAGELIAIQRAEAAAARVAWRDAWRLASRKKLRAWFG